MEIFLKSLITQVQQKSFVIKNQLREIFIAQSNFNDGAFSQESFIVDVLLCFEHVSAILCVQNWTAGITIGIVMKTHQLSFLQRFVQCPGFHKKLRKKKSVLDQFGSFSFLSMVKISFPVVVSLASISANKDVNFIGYGSHVLPIAFEVTNFLNDT